MKVIKLCVLTAMMLIAGLTTVMAQNGDEIIQKHIDAIGGFDNWAKINSMKLSGSMNVQGMDISMTQTVVNEKGMRMDISIMGMNCYTIITPKEGWVYMPIQPGMDKVTPMSADDLKASQDKLNVKNIQLVDKSKMAKSEYIGKDTVNSVICYKVKVTDKEGNIQKAFFDTATYFMVRTEYNIGNAESNIKVLNEEQELGVNFSNFQKIPEGVTIPMTWGSPQGDIAFKSIEINKIYEESIFKPAAEVKK